MDTSDPFITFDLEGNCNHCTEALKKLKRFQFSSDQERKDRLNEVVSKIKLSGKHKKYDCIIGLSGGVDSSYLAYVVVKDLGLRPLAIHVDNGWNSELAVKNIERIVTKLNIDLFTWVIDWEVFRDLQKSYLRASVLDIEVLSDNAIVVAIDKLMRKNRIQYFLIGFNYQAESIMPAAWLYSPKYDSLNIKSIYAKHGSGSSLNTYPLLSLPGYIRYRYFNNRIAENILDLVPYEKEKAIKVLENELGWQNYGGKHYESIITKFYQSYLLPVKFGVDKRRAHLSSLICSGQINRDDALQELRNPLYNDQMLTQDKEYFMKKMEFSEEEFLEIMQTAPRSHYVYKSYNEIDDKLRHIFRNAFKRS